jgi:hypothetical protein
VLPQELSRMASRAIDVITIATFPSNITHEIRAVAMDHCDQAPDLAYN